MAFNVFRSWMLPAVRIVAVGLMVYAALVALDGGSRYPVACMALLAVCLIAAANWGIAKDPLYPPFVLGLVWAVTLAIYLWSDLGLPALHAETGSLIVLGYLAFSIGGALHGDRRVAGTPAQGLTSDTTSGYPSRWVVAVALVGLPIFIYKAYQLGQSGLSENLMINLRRALTEEDEGASLGLAAYAASFAVFGSVLSTSGVATLSRLEKVILFLAALAYAFFSTGRTSFLLLFAASGSALAIRGRVKLRTVALIGGLAFTTIYLSVGTMLGKIGSEEGGAGASPVDAVQAYLLGGMAALDDVVSHAKPLMLGDGTFRFVHAVLHQLKLGPPPVTLFQEFRDVGVVTNVYTVHRLYFDDFSWPGVLIAQLAFGWAHALAYFHAKRGARPMVFVYAVLMYPLIMQVFQDQYFNLMSTWVQALMLLVVSQWWERRSRRRAGAAAGDRLMEAEVTVGCL